MHVPRFLAAVCLGLTLSAASASAHHAFNAEYDEKDRVRLTGAIREVEWVNPHALLRLTVREPDGKTTDWQVELGTPAMLSSRGVRKDDLRIGAKVTVDGYRARSKAMTAAARILTLSDGTDLFVR